MRDAAPGLDAELVLALARLQGHLELDEATAARIATGAANAIRAVVASAADVELFDTEPQVFLAELERLADADDGGG